MEIKAVLFDFGGTLFEYYPSNAEVWVNICKRLGFDISVDNQDLLNGLANQHRYLEDSVKNGNLEWNTADWENPNDKTLQKWNNLVFSSLNIKHNFPHQIIYEEFKKREGTYKIIKESKPLIEELTRKKIKIGMVSNTSESGASIRRPILKKHGLLKYFKILVFSSEVNFSKPDPRIFRLALEALQISPKNALYIGDSLYHDINGAKNIGLLPVLYDPMNFFSYDGLKIRNLLDLLKIIA